MDIDSSTESENMKNKINLLKNLNIDNFKPGLYVDALDDTKAWCIAHIIERKGDFIKVHYEGWSNKFDEVIKVLY